MGIDKNVIPMCATPNGAAISASPLASVGGPQRFGSGGAPRALVRAEVVRLRSVATAEADALMGRFADEIEHLRRRLVAVASLHGRSAQAVDAWEKSLSQLKSDLGR